MDKVNGRLTVYFEEPFWVGIFEHIEDGKLSVAKVTFGVEPKEYEENATRIFKNTIIGEDRLIKSISFADK